MVASGKLEPDMFLAMDAGNVQTRVQGIETTEPVYGLPALWVATSNKEQAEINGYTVIDPESVFITHLAETLKRHAGEILTREDVQLLIDRLRKSQPTLVGDVIPELVPVGLLQRVLKNLLANSIPVRQLSTIIETLAENISKTKNAEVLTEMVRKALSRTITEMHKSESNKILAITIEPSLEHKLISALQQQGDSLSIAVPAEVTMELSQELAQAWKKAMDQGKDKVVLTCDSRLRLPLASTISRTVPPLAVIAYDEILLGTEVEPIDTIALPQAQLLGSNERELVPA